MGRCLNWSGGLKENDHNRFVYLSFSHSVKLFESISCIGRCSCLIQSLSLLDCRFGYIALSYWSRSMCAPMLSNMMKMDEIFETVIQAPIIQYFLLYLVMSSLQSNRTVKKTVGKIFDSRIYLKTQADTKKGMMICYNPSSWKAEKDRSLGLAFQSA